jgi:hypothetical protein
MRLSTIGFSLFWATLLAGGPALAQPTGPATCTGDIAGTVGLSVDDGSGHRTPVPTAMVPYVFGAAECQCASDPGKAVNLEIQLTQALPANIGYQAEVWYGIGCDDFSVRQNQTQTQCVRAGRLDPGLFVLGSASSSSVIDIPIDARLLTTGGQGTCAPWLAANNIYVLIYQDPLAPLGVCTLPLTENTRPPEGPRAVAVHETQGDGFVVTWQPPPTSGSVTPTQFQVLCADSHGQPIATAGRAPAAYSTCEGSVLHRRGLTTASSPSGALASLDPAYVCSPGILVQGAGDYAARIAGLERGASYQALVVAVDQYGNATPSAIVTTGPLSSPPEPPKGGCSIAGDAAHPGALALLLLFASAMLVARRVRVRYSAADL